MFSSSDPIPERRATFDPPTGMLIVTRRHNTAHGSLDEMERFARDILRAIAAQRLARYTAVAPPFIDTLHDI